MKTHIVNTNTYFKEKSNHIWTIFLLTVNLAISVVLLWVFTGFFRFLRQNLEQFIKNQAVFHCCFVFERGSCFRQRRFWPIKHLINITTQPIVLLLGFAIYFTVHSLKKIINLRKQQVLFKKRFFEKKAILSDQKTWQQSPFSGRYKTPLFYTRSLLNIRYHTFKKVDECFCNSSFFVKKNFFKEEEKILAFLANSTPVIRRNECQKTFGEGPRSVFSTIHAFDITNTGISYTCRWEKFFNCNES